MIIYILCYNEEVLTTAKQVYHYPWARPILLDKQDYTFENVFWNQLDKLYDEWKDHDYVGVLSHSAFKKIDIQKLNNQLPAYTSEYVHFFGYASSVIDPRFKYSYHPHLYQIMVDCLRKFKLKGNECFCNYFMCHPSWMKKFIDWYNEIIPLLFKHPLIWTDSKYSNLSKEQLIELCGYPYYPHVPFVLERLNGCFFQTYCKTITIDNFSLPKYNGSLAPHHRTLTREAFKIEEKMAKR